MSDKLIKASDAVDVVAKHSALYGNGEVSTDEGETLLYDIMSEVMNLLPAQPEQRWIPVSERLPERYGWYLCTLKDGRVNCYYWNKKGEWVDNGKKHFFDLYNIRSRYTGEEINPEQEGSVYWTDWVIAWMPMPEPYKEGDSDERS